MTSIGATARWMAAARAIETELDRPLFRDPYARSLAGDIGFQMMMQLSPVEEVTDPRLLTPDAYTSIRTRFFDDALTRVVGDRGLAQVVLLAAGADTRAFRLTWSANTVIYEIDRDDVFNWKEPILKSHQVSLTGQRRIVRADLCDDWAGSLVAAGFNPTLPTAFLAEGILMYLESNVVQTLLATVTSVAAPRSWLGSDAVSPELLQSKLSAGTMSRLRDFGIPFQSAMTDPKSDFATHGWDAIVVPPRHAAASYGRRLFADSPLKAPKIPRAYLISANRRVDQGFRFS